MALRLSIAAMRGTRAAAAAAVRRPFCSSSSSIESSDKKTIADYDWVRVADRIDSVAQRVERIDQQLQELLLSQQPPRLHKGDKLYSISDQDQFEYSDAFCNINYIPPKYHDPGLPKFYKAAQRAIDSFNQSKNLKLELIKVDTAFIGRDDKTGLVIKARTFNTPGGQPLIYKGIVLFEDEKLKEVIPMVASM